MEKIIEDVKKGNKEAYSVLIKEYQQELFNIAKNRTLNEEEVMDVFNKISAEIPNKFNCRLRDK